MKWLRLPRNMVPNMFHRFLFVCCIAVVAIFASVAVKADESVAKPQITKDEFEDLIGRGSPISKRTIDGDLINQELEWLSQGDKAAQQKEAPAGILIEDSVISGALEVPTTLAELAEDLGVDVPDEGGEPPGLTIHVPFVISRSNIKAYFSLDHVTFSNIKITDSTFLSGASFRRTEFGQADFSKTTFEGVSFAHAQFTGPAAFRRTTFKDGANFARASFDKELLLENSITNGTMTFRRAMIRGTLSLISGSFPKGISFEYVNSDSRNVKSNEGSIKIINSLISNFLILRDSAIQSFSLFSDKASQSWTIVDGRASFQRFSCDECDLQAAEFRDIADFGSSQFGSALILNRATFNKEVFLDKAVFPVARPRTSEEHVKGLALHNTIFRQPVQVEWKQLKSSVDTELPGTWRGISKIMAQNDQTTGVNESEFRADLLEAKEDKDFLGHLTRNVSYYVWGYGYRLTFLLSWLIALFLVFHFNVLVTNESSYEK